MADTMLGAIYDRLASEAAVTSRLSTYQGDPAIFSGEVPEDATGWWLIIESLDETHADTKTTRGRDRTWDISAFGPASGSALPLEALVEAVKDALHRRPVSYTGAAGWRARVVADSDAPTDDTMYGRTITVQLSVEEI